MFRQVILLSFELPRNKNTASCSIGVKIICTSSKHTVYIGIISTMAKI